LLLCLVFIKSSLITARFQEQRDFGLMFFVVSAWAAMGLADNLLLVLVGWYLFLFAINRWLTGRGLKWRIFLLRDDYADDGGDGV
jgi:hypothetical protein